MCVFCQETELHHLFKTVIEQLQQGSIAWESDLLVLHSNNKCYEKSDKVIILYLKQNTHRQQAVGLSLW